MGQKVHKRSKSEFHTGGGGGGGWKGGYHSQPEFPPLDIWDIVHEKKTISGGARQAAKRSLDSAVSSLLAFISRQYTQLV